MKQPRTKHTWIDDENHPLKGYPIDELDFIEETWLEIVKRKISEIFKKQLYFFNLSSIIVL